MNQQEIEAATRLADACINEMEALRGLVGTKPLTKRAEDDPVHDMTKAAATAPAGTLDDDTLNFALASIAALTGVTDPGELVKIIGAALAEPVDMDRSPAAAAELAKAVAAEPMRECTVGGVPDAVAEFDARRDHLEHLAKNAGGVPAARLREARGDAEAIRVARELRPITFAAPPAWVDTREELRTRRDAMRRLGHVDIADALQRELDVAEGSAATRTPTASIPWGGRATPLA